MNARYLGKQEVFQIPSESQPGVTHFVVRVVGEGLRCSCTGFGVRGHCYHVDAVAKFSQWLESQAVAS